MTSHKLRRRQFAALGLAPPASLLARALPDPLGPAALVQRAETPQEPFTPGEGPNRPMGTGVGVHPGRVVWVRDPASATWDGKTGEWWDDSNCDPRAVAGMLSSSIRSLAGEKSDQQAWRALFAQFNRSRGLGGAGYKAGEKIAVKINANQDRGTPWATARGMPSPQAIHSLVAQLVQAAGVPPGDITIYDAARFIGDPVYRRVTADFPGVRFVVSPAMARDGRLAANPDKAHPVHFADPSLPPAYLPDCVTQAKYLVNMALLRPHGMFGVTLAAKNHFGSVCFPENGGWTPRILHGFGARSRPVGSYNALVELMGHPHLGGKTLLYVLDGLYTAEHNEGRVMRFESFGGQWAASLLVSQDPVAIDSVGLDILRSEPRATQVRGNPDNYLHEAALAAKPASGTLYDPDQDSKPLASLGVHEHWNNAADRKYSRNLGRREGIELIALHQNA